MVPFTDTITISKLNEVFKKTRKRALSVQSLRIVDFVESNAGTRRNDDLNTVGLGINAMVLPEKLKGGLDLILKAITN